MERMDRFGNNNYQNTGFQSGQQMPPQGGQPNQQYFDPNQSQQMGGYDSTNYQGYNGDPIIEDLEPDYQEPLVSNNSSFGGGKKKIIIIIAVAVLVLLLGGGGVFLLLSSSEEAGSEVDPQSTVANNYYNVEIDWVIPNLPEQSEDVYRDIIKDFEAINKTYKVEVNLEVMPYDEVDYYLDLMEAVAMDASPDIITIRNDDLPAYKDYMLPILAFSNEDLVSYKDSFVNIVLNDTMINDQVYAVTTYVDNMQLYYNEDILEQASIALPASKTWDSLEAQLDDIKQIDQDGNIIISPVSLGTGGLLKSQTGREPNIENHGDIMAMLVLQYGGRFYDVQEEDVLFRTSTKDSDKGSDPLYQASKYYLSYSNPFELNRYSWNEEMDNNLELFAQGKLAYMINYKRADLILKEKNPALRYKMIELPQYSDDDQNKITLGRYFMYGLSKSLADPNRSSERYWAERFLQYLSTKEVQNKYVTQVEVPSARRDIIVEQSKLEGVGVFAEGALIARSYYKPDVLRCERLWTEMLEKAKYQDFERSLQDAVKEYREIAKAGPKTRRVVDE